MQVPIKIGNTLLRDATQNASPSPWGEGRPGGGDPKNFCPKLKKLFSESVGDVSNNVAGVSGRVKRIKTFYDHLWCSWYKLKNLILLYCKIHFLQHFSKECCRRWISQCNKTNFSSYITRKGNQGGNTCFSIVFLLKIQLLRNHAVLRRHKTIYR